MLIPSNGSLTKALLWLQVPIIGVLYYSEFVHPVPAPLFSAAIGLALASAFASLALRIIDRRTSAN